MRQETQYQNNQCNLPAAQLFYFLDFWQILPECLSGQAVFFNSFSKNSYIDFTQAFPFLKQNNKKKQTEKKTFQFKILNY